MRFGGNDLHAWRAVTTWVIRLPSAAAIAYGTYLLLKKVAFGVGSGHTETIMDVYMGVGEDHDTYQGFSMIVIGAAAGLLAPRIARWIVTVPETGCPRCGYDAKPGVPCPECGYEATS